MKHAGKDGATCFGLYLRVYVVMLCCVANETRAMVIFLV